MIAFDFMNAADVMAEKGEYASALYYYFLQRNLEYDSDVDVAIADVYMEMGLVGEATKYYFYAYSADETNKDAVEGLVCCFKEWDDEAALFYLHRLALFDDAEIDFDPGEFPMLNDSPRLTVHDRADKSEVLGMAFDHMHNFKIDKAKELLESIAEGDHQFCDSRMALASIMLEENKPTDAIELTADALKVNPKHVGLHMVMVMALDALGRNDEVDEWIKRVDMLDNMTEEETAKTGLCLMNYRPLSAKKYLLRTLDYAPYDKLNLMCLAAVCLEEENKPEAVKFINRVCSVYPDDVLLKEVAHRIYNDNFHMPGDLLAIKDEWTKRIKTMLIGECGDLTDPENVKCIKWLLSSDEDMYLQVAVCTYITGMPEFEDVINDFLCNPNVVDIPKKHIIMRKLCDPRQKRVNFVVGNIFRSLKLRHPDLPANLLSAYYLVFASLAVEVYTFESALSHSLRKLKKAYEECETRDDLPVGALAVILRKLTKDGDEAQYCKLYDTDLDEYRKVVEALGL